MVSGSVRRALISAAAVVVGSLCASSGAHAQAYPNRPVTLVVGQAAGGTSDIFARLFAQALTSKFGTVVVENVSGAGGTIAATRVARANPDGHTVLLGSSGINAIAYSQYNELSYKPEDFVPVAHIVNTWIVVAARKSLGVKTMDEFIALAKARPNEITMGHTGKGQTTHLVCLLLEQAAGIKLRMVPYRGGGEALNAVLGGSIDGVCSGVPGIGSNIVANEVVGLAVGGAERIDMIADTPSATDIKLPGLAAPVWIAVFAPKGTSPEIVKKLNAALSEAMADPTLVEALRRTGSSVPPEGQRGVEALDQLVSNEIKRWAAVLERAGATKE
jgi:tripartite-type tricarboxylate transporter receptor subunit TctC